MTKGRMVSSSSTSASGRMPKSVVSDPWGSVSITSTLCPSKDIPWANVIAVVVLPTPPLKLAMLMVTASAPAGLKLALRYSRTQALTSVSVNWRRFPTSLSMPTGRSPRPIRCVSDPFSMPRSWASWLRFQTGAALRVVGDNMADRICDIISTECAACSAISARPIGAGALMLSFDM